MARARAVVGGLLLVLIAAPAYAAPPSHSYGLGELLGPVVTPLQPVTESVGTVLAPITEPVGEILDPVVDPVVEVLSPITDPLLDPVEEVVDPITDPLLDPVEDVVDPITDPLLDPVEEVVDPLLDPVEDVVDPPLEPNPPPVGGGNPPGLETNSSQSPADVAGASVGPVSSSTADLVSSAVSLLPPPSAGVVLSPTLAQSLLSQILDWLSEFDVGSFLTAPFLGLQVLLRALASAGRGLLVPGAMLAVFAILMARDRRIQGTKTP
jgi:uncharacterized protein YggT (Ycf19 family)